MKRKILIVDDDVSVRKMLAIVLKDENRELLQADDAMTALKCLSNESIDLLISDIKMPDITGIALLKKIKSVNPNLPVIMITAYASTDEAVEAMKQGAFDYVTKPFNIDELKLVVERALTSFDLKTENIKLKDEIESRDKYENLIGKNEGMKKIFSLITTIANTDSSVLIQGESGTGKELIAQAIHRQSPRKNSPFVSINCGALPETLLESELFGHVKGAFTDAYRDKTGLFESAHLGTLFLDEISEMSLHMQVKLLRAIQEQKVRPVGGQKEIDVDVKLISATNRDLKTEIEKGRFRTDLYYRLNVFNILVPPLRDRTDDIPLLMSFFLNRYKEKLSKEMLGFDETVTNILTGYNWPGNVRELENTIERAVALESGQTISLRSIPKELVYHMDPLKKIPDDLESFFFKSGLPLQEFIDLLSHRLLLSALDKTSQNLRQAAELLGINYRSIRYLMEKQQGKKK
jgi:DNA-binding NtrC family response regulator